MDSSPSSHAKTPSICASSWGVMVLSLSFQSPWVPPPQSMTQGIPPNASQSRNYGEQMAAWLLPAQDTLQ